VRGAAGPKVVGVLDKVWLDRHVRYPSGRRSEAERHRGTRSIDRVATRRCSATVPGVSMVSATRPSQAAGVEGRVWDRAYSGRMSTAAYSGLRFRWTRTADPWARSNADILL